MVAPGFRHSSGANFAVSTYGPSTWVATVSSTPTGVVW